MKKALSVLLVLALLLSCCPVLPLQAQAATEGLYTYTVTDGKATITACDKSASGVVIIPDTLGGYPVTKIGDQAFISNKNITFVEVPDGVTGIYWQAFAYCSNLTTVVLPQSLTTIGSDVFTYCSALSSITLPAELESIGEYAFQDCHALTEMIIPEGVTQIPEGAFWCCYALKEVTLPVSVTYIDYRAFSSCDITDVYYGGTKLQWQAVGGSGKDALTEHIRYLGVSNDPEIVKSLSFQLYDGEITITGSDESLYGDVVIPATIEGYPVTAIDNMAFSERSITSVVLPDSITTIGWDAFAECPILESATLGSGATQLEAGIFYNCYRLKTVVLPEGLTRIPGSTFSGCESLTEITVPNSVTAIGNEAFRGCSALTQLLLPEFVTTIGMESFHGCTGLTQLTLPDSVTSVDEYAFRDCRNLQTLSIGKGLANLGTGAFYGCDGLKSITVAPENASFASDAQGALMNKACTKLLLIPQSNVADFVIPQTITEIGYGVFADCWQLEEIAIPQSVTSIDSYAFANTNLTSLHLPEGITSIGNSAFYDCDKLTEITVPGSADMIPAGAFQDCSNLERVTLGEGIRTICYAAFAECDKLTAIAIPSTVTTIESDAFDSCDSLFYVYYGGTPEQWAQMDIGYGNEALEEARMRYEATMPEVPEVPSVADMLTYTIADGCVTITDCMDTLSGDVVIPATIEGCPITAIAATAFAYCRGITAVTLPDSVVSIGRRAFFSCSNLTSIQLGAGVAQIDIEAFNDSYNLLAIRVPESNPHFKNDAQGVLLSKDGTLLVAAPGALETYTVPDTVVTVGNSAFSGCRSLTELVFGKHVTTLEDYSFANCTSLTAVHITAGITSIGEDVFANCDNLSRFEVAAENPQYSNDSRGVLFNKDKTVLLEAPQMLSGSYTAPGSVLQVGGGAFKYCYELTDVVFGNNLTQLCDMAFYGSGVLNSITLPVSLQSVGWWAFQDCWPNVVYYTGTREQWAQVEIDDSGNDSLTYANIVYEHVAYTPGDLDGAEGVNEDDVIYLLQYLLMPGDFAVDQSVDYDKNDTVDEDYVIYLLQHLLMPGEFPLR